MKGSDCEKCPVSEWNCDAQYRGSRCAALRAKAGADFDPKTNADRLRSMSDEELAAWICLPDCTAERYETCFTITTEKRFDVPYDRQTEPLQNVLDWLRQPAEEVSQ